MSLRVNFADTELKDFEPVPTGWYLASITDAEVRESKTGNDYVWLELTIQQPEQYAGKKVWNNASLQSHALFTLLEVGLACDLIEEGQTEFEFDVDDFIGKEVAIRCKYKKETSEFDASNDVKKTLSADQYYEKAGTEESALMP